LDTHRHFDDGGIHPRDDPRGTDARTVDFAARSFARTCWRGSILRELFESLAFSLKDQRGGKIEALEVASERFRTSGDGERSVTVE